MTSGKPCRTGKRALPRFRFTVAAVSSLYLSALLAPTPAHADGVSVFKNVQYGIADGYPLLLDAYVPDSISHPAVVVIHGGSWTHNSKAEFASEGQKLAAAGFAAFSINYRLSPPGGTWHSPAAYQDVQTAVKWVRANAQTYAVDPARVGALGGSVGGYLAMMLGTTGETGQERVSAVVSWSGIADLRTSSPTDAKNATTYLGCALADCPDLWDAASPLNHVDNSTAPTFLANSTNEANPLQQATDMAQRLDQAGIAHTVRVVDGNLHSRHYSDEVWDETVAFLRLYLAASPSGQSGVGSAAGAGTPALPSSAGGDEPSNSVSAGPSSSSALTEDQRSDAGQGLVP